ncbi:hypothetical protein AALP_AA5G228000 [Arabis alpina]|uniref:MATH domain-containing protein n=1 Tax=Arabis alpina TaxID=50452 RepID=A0A087GYU8_ARAAL|nr:hypothetical protein AALP_AA5G228000 [Arabis alpina]
MGNLVDNKLTWVIQNFNSLQQEIFSDQFVVGGCKWNLIVFPKGDDKVGYLSLFLTVSKGESLPCGWRRHAKVSFTIVNQLSEQLSRKAETQQWFDESDKTEKPEEETTQPLKKRKQDNDGVLSSEVNGFLVLPSQVESVKRIFGKHPDMALEFRAKNQHLRTARLNVLLSLIETLCQSPQGLSKEDLVEADSALAYVKDAGFKVDWLEKKLEEVKKKKEDEQSGETRIQELELELKDFKQKCLNIEAQLEKETAKVLAARISLTLDDFV